MAPFTVAQFRQLLEEAAKEDTLDALKDHFADGNAGVRLHGPNGQLISQSNPLEVRVRQLESELQQLRALLTSGDAKMQLSGSSVPDGQPIPAKLLGTRADTLARRFTGMYRIARVGPLAATTTETVADITDGASYDIEYIELATNHDSDIRFTIQGYQENGVLAGAMRPITATGSSEIGLSAANVRQHGSAQWELEVDDPQQNRYKLVCKRQVPVGRGFRVQVTNANMTTSYNAGVIIQYNKTAS